MWWAVTSFLHTGGSGLSWRMTGPAPKKPRQLAADYRWTVPKVSAFLEALSKSGVVAEAARSVGMSRQSAYRLRARLDAPEFRAIFEDARAHGRRKRAAERLRARRSEWDGLGLEALDYLRACGPQRDISPAQGDRHPPQGDTYCAKATQMAPDTVTCVNTPPPETQAAGSELDQAAVAKASSPSAMTLSLPASILRRSAPASGRKRSM